MNGDTPIDTFEPQFTQREAETVSGTDAKTINNWIDRGHLTLTPVKDRRLTGRRLFSVADIAQIQTMDYCARLLDLPPSVSARAAEAVRNFLSFAVNTPATDDGKRYKVWHIFKRNAVGDGVGDWYLQGIWQHPKTGAFYQYDPGIYGTEDFGGFPHFPCVMIPTSEIALRVFLKCADLLMEEAGHAPGTASQGLDDE